MLKLIRARLNSKTYRVAIVGTLLVILEQNSGVISALLPVGLQPWAVMLWPVLMITLRELTNSALDKK
jgi:hypothetical protein